MSHRIVERIEEFDRELLKLSKKHSGLKDEVENILDGLATDQISDGDQLTGCGGHPVFKKRCGTGSIGKRRGARIVYYKDDLRLGALVVYFKNRQANVTSTQVMDRLKKFLSFDSKG